MLIAGCLRFNAEGRVVVSLTGPAVAFNGGTPVTADGSVLVDDNPPDAYLAGFGYRAEGAICARAGLGGGPVVGGLATGPGGLALATAEPIASYIAGIPVVADGRVAVAFEGPVVPPPVNTSGFDSGYDAQAFH